MTRPEYLADEVPKMAAELVRLRSALSAAERRVGELEAALRTCVPDTHGMCPVCKAWWPWDRNAKDRAHAPGCSVVAALAAKEGTK
jgi:hypothetical protein